MNLSSSLVSMDVNRTNVTITRVIRTMLSPSMIGKLRILQEIGNRQSDRRVNRIRIKLMVGKREEIEGLEAAAFS